MANAMDKLTEAREKLMQRAETARTRMGGSGGRLLMGGGGMMNGANAQERMNEMRTRVQTRIQGLRQRQTRVAGRDGPLDILGGGDKKVESIDLPPATTARKVISV